MPSRFRWLLAAAAVIVLVVLTVLVASTRWLASLGGSSEGARLQRVHASPQFLDGRFQNRPPAKMIEGSTSEMLRRQFFGKEQREPSGPIPVATRSGRDYETPPASGLRATWLGWATVLVEIDGRRILTDPVWSERCSPSTLAGPKRFHAPPIALEDLPPIDAVVISHDHYDHLDMPAIEALSLRGAHFFVPLGVGADLERWNVPPARIHELDWNDRAEIAGLAITATPSRHYSGRSLLDGNETLWASWVIAGPRHRLWFSGDTGYTEEFREIGARHGPFDLTLIKIGAYDRSWRDIHMEPEAAVRAHQDVRGRVMLPIHWATFNLAIHDWSEPAERTAAAAQAAKVTLVLPRPGELVDITDPPRVENWWRAGVKP